MIITDLKASDTRDLRSRILRPGRPLEECIYPNDEKETSFHLGMKDGNKIIVIVSFYQEEHPDFKGGMAYRFRGMATDENYRKKGYATEVLKRAFQICKEKGADSIWCNARVNAYKMYERMGMKIQSDEFDIPNIGPHYLMRIEI